MKALFLATIFACLPCGALSQEYTVTTTPIDKTLPSSLAQSVIDENTLKSSTVQEAIDKAVTLTRPVAEPSPLDKAWTDSSRAKRKHWYSMPNPVMNTYHDTPSDVIVTPKKLKGYRDARPWPQQHPVKAKFLKARKVCQTYNPFIDTIAGIGNLLQFAKVIH